MTKKNVQMDTGGLILETLNEKSTVKLKAFDNTLNTFSQLKKLLAKKEREINAKLGTQIDERIKLEYIDKGKFDAQLKVASDLLIFSMHSNIFEFDRDHSIWKNSYVQKETLNSYCGIINIYNFLNDSFVFNRLDDLGYLIARIFINRENHYFVEGKRQPGVFHNKFGTSVINSEDLGKIADSAILYCLNFDLLVPPYDTAKIVSVAQMNEKIVNSRLQTGKRLGFTFNSDDISMESKEKTK
jgi:hypothetical protein